MKVEVAVDIVKRALENPVSTWLDYTPKNIPMAIYDDDEFVFINHPNPPSERPDNLMAATAIDINGALTATIPLAACDDEQELIALVYHECFHVYQGQRFQYNEEYHFFEIMAFYPELNPAYRALCSAETDILNDDTLSPQEKVEILSYLTHKRRQILAQHDGLLDFEKNLERTEALASFVDQKAKQQRFNIVPDNSRCLYSYARQYFVGAAICWLFEQTYSSEEWQTLVEGGKSLSELLLQNRPHETDLPDLDLENRENLEKQTVEQVLAETNQKIQTLLDNGAMTIKIPRSPDISRSFSPSSLVSLGDGRLLHSEIIIIQTPKGQIFVEDELAFEDYMNGTVTFPARPYKLEGDK
ncbi:MAG: hypothetical protein JXR84_28070, partial [Anaerolineae bacterium]|nr:hypothetical protein [Anaerolineae bacterium]